MSSQEPTRVAVDGSTGYLGNHVVAQLRAQNIPVRAIVHAGSRQEDKEFLLSLGAEVVEASMDKAGPALEQALAGCFSAIHLIGSIAPRKGEKLEDLHGRQTANWCRAAQAAGVKLLVQVTALGTKPDAISAYHRTKFQAEEHVRVSGIPYVIFRPSLIIGRTVGSRDSKLVTRYRQLIKSRPSIPVIGGGKNKIQPIFVADLAAAIAYAATSQGSKSGAYEIGGDQVLTMHAFVEKLIAMEGLSKAIKAIPVPLASILATFCEAFQSVPLISKDQITLSSLDNICHENAIEKVFGIKPTSLDIALSTYNSTGSPKASQVAR